MELQVWEDGARKLIPSIEGVLKNVLLKKIQVEMSASSFTEPSMTTEALKTGTVVIRGKEKQSGIELFVAYDENWLPQLSNAMLGVEETELNEITQDLIKEFSSQLVGALQSGLQELEITTEPGDVEILKSGQIAKTVTSDHYYMIQLDVSGKFEIDGDELPQLALIIAVSVPDDQAVSKLIPGSEEESVAEAADEVVEQGASGGHQTTQQADGGNPGNSARPGMEAGAGQGRQESSASSSDTQKQNPAKKVKNNPVESQPVEFDEISSSSQSSQIGSRNLDILKDVELDISVELGRKEVPLGEILHMVRGSVIELDKLAGEPVEIYANGHRIAEGEVVVIDENFGVRVTNLVSTRERLETLR